jgi:uncharacterized RDD family membrane protein YckC
MTAQGVLGRFRRRKGPKAPDDGWREFVTPEGVDLRLKIGSYAERFSAIALDFLILAGGFIGFSLLVLLAGWAVKAEPAMEFLGVVWLVGTFLIRNFYFMAFEIRPRSATPGKRVMGLRVIAADGGRLTADAVFARNAMREVEVFLPLTFFAAQGQGVDAALISLGAIWSGVFVVFPLFNRDRRRLGDLAAGTLVVKAPKKLLQPDLVDAGAAAASELAITQSQVDVYGVKELHVLEDVLRAGNRRAVAEVAQRIRTKIGWEGPADLPDRTFLTAYYAALRARLEGRMLFGHRRKDKFDKA